MKHTENRSGRLGRRARGTVITVLVLVVVILLNLGISILGTHYLWVVDETITKYHGDAHKSSTDNRTLYTLDPLFTDLIADSAIPMVDKVNEERVAAGEVPLKINIIFCNDRDKIDAATATRYIMYTALNLQKEFPDYVDVQFINIEKNPSAVQQYKVTSSSHIYSTNVIFEFGTEFRIYSANYMFNTNDSDEVWAYNGEKNFANAILAVTRAESPIACFLTNHGENTEDCATFRALVERAGYIVTDLDLEKEDIPENCRMLISYDPQTDFRAFGDFGEESVSEIEKLDRYLDQCYGFMLFIDNETPVMPNLEEYLEEWGVEVCRAEGETEAVTEVATVPEIEEDRPLTDSSETTADITADVTADTSVAGSVTTAAITAAETDSMPPIDADENYHIRDMVQHLDKDGYTLIGTYATSGLGASLTSDMRSVSYPAKVLFPNSTAIRMSDAYHYTYVEADEAEGTEAYRYGSYYRNGVSRYMSAVFTAGDAAIAEIGGKQYEITTQGNNFQLMTLTSEERTVQETDYIATDDRSYVCVFGSTEFASDEVLTSAAYGNADVLTSALRAMGREVVPVDLEFKAFKVYDIAEGSYTSGGVLATAVCLTVIPAVLCFGMGIYVNVKRKYK